MREDESPYESARAVAVRSRLGVTQAEMGRLLRQPDHRRVQRLERGRQAIEGSDRSIYEALECALSRFTPTQVWGPADLPLGQRLTRIFIHAYTAESAPSSPRR